MPTGKESSGLSADRSRGDTEAGAFTSLTSGECDTLSVCGERLFADAQQSRRIRNIELQDITTTDDMTTELSTGPDVSRWLSLLHWLGLLLRMYVALAFLLSGLVAAAVGLPFLLWEGCVLLFCGRKQSHCTMYGIKDTQRENSTLHNPD